MQSSTHFLIRPTVAFVELLSLGFATIGVPATLVAIGGQLLGTEFTLNGRPQGRTTWI